MAIRELEGTWEEILAHASELAGRRLHVTLLPDAAEVPSDADTESRPSRLATALAEIGRRARHMSPRPDDRDFLREGRAGGMFA
jgi:hypothetical protein